MRLNLEELLMTLGGTLLSVVWNNESRSFATVDGSCREPGDARFRFVGEQPWATALPTGAQIDSRRVKPGDLFFCLPGERVDGHDFALDAAKAGAVAIVASRDPFAAVAPEKGAGPLPPVFVVKDVKTALARMAMYHRDSTAARVVGITGTAGKTSVKEVLAQVLSVCGHTARNPMNLNNQIGLPLSMLNASAEASFWIMEAGISEPHDMDELGAILRPDLCIILNVGEAHITGLGKEGVAACKSRFLDHIQPDGTAYVSADYPDLSREVEGRLSALAHKRITCLRFSARTHEGVHCSAEYAGAASDTAGGYRVRLRDQEFMVESPFRGDFGSENVAAIVGAASLLGLDVASITKGLATAILPGQRFSCHRYGSFMLVDDSYNANPLSSTRMLQAVASMAREAGLPLYLVMGEMLELGDTAEEAHRALGACMAAQRPEVVFWKGGHAEAVKKGLAEGAYAGAFFPVGGGQDFSLLLEEFNPVRGLFLFKGSRGNQLERLVDIFREKAVLTGEGHAV